MNKRTTLFLTKSQRWRPDATVRDVPDQNRIVVYVAASDGLWHARIGPEHAMVEMTGGTPWHALMLLQLKIKQGGYRFDHESVLDI